MRWPRHVPLDAVLFQEIAATLSVLHPFRVDATAGSFAVPPQTLFVNPDSTPPFDDVDGSAALGGTPCSGGNDIVRVCVLDACRRRLYALHDAMAGMGDHCGPVSDVIDRLLHWSLPAIQAEFGDEVGDGISSSLPSRVCGRDFTLRYMPGVPVLTTVRGVRRVQRAKGWGIKYCEFAIDTVMRRGEPVTLMVDGRYDSARGAQHCIVTAMEYETRLVVGVHTLRPKIEGKASNALEVPAVVQLLRGLIDKGLKIRCVVADDCALGPKLRAMNIEWHKDWQHKIKNIRKHFHSMLQLKEAKKVSSPHDCVSEAQFIQFTKKRLKEALEQLFGLDVLTPAEERLKKSDFAAVVMRKMYPYGSRLNARALETDPDGLTEYHAHEVGMWFLHA
ncbi:hypothetical protein CBR_g19085 [Chara braunii]|uniref:Uncharacterized protein n=1 Tax=Chara braunii TaxID=69332 RepID=A0A388KXD0_CHABU|nr:hypothetical protein CBR_g19085 [Chara braunii]|eukprot:GBG74678.1 hypothetical protein CBR_g19085 [Chara braunii]